MKRLLELGEELKANKSNSNNNNNSRDLRNSGKKPRPQHDEADLLEDALVEELAEKQNEIQFDEEIAIEEDWSVDGKVGELIVQ